MTRLKTGAARTGVAGCDRVWPAALARAAREELGLELAVTGLAPANLGAEQLRSSTDALILPLVGDGGASGAVIIGATVFQGIVEWQLSGRITPTAQARAPTRTDAMLIQPWIECAFRLMTDMLADDDDLATLSGYQIEAISGNFGALSGDFRRIGGTVRIADCGEGECAVILPPRAAIASPNDRDRQFTEDLKRQVLGIQATMQAVLCRMTVPLGTVMSLREGAAFPLSGATVQDMSIEGADGKVLAHGQLGQHRGMRAVRLAQKALDTPAENVVTPRAAS